MVGSALSESVSSGERDTAGDAEPEREGRGDCDGSKDAVAQREPRGVADTEPLPVLLALEARVELGCRVRETEGEPVPRLSCGVMLLLPLRELEGEAEGEGEGRGEADARAEGVTGTVPLCWGENVAHLVTVAGGDGVAGGEAVLSALPLGCEKVERAEAVSAETLADAVEEVETLAEREGRTGVADTTALSEPPPTTEGVSAPLSEGAAAEGEKAPLTL